MNRHIPDEDLILGVDGELDAERQRLVDGHLSRCAACMDRRIRLSRALSDFKTAYETPPQPVLPKRHQWAGRGRTVANLAIAAAFLIAITLTGWSVFQRSGHRSAPRMALGLLPDPGLSPGAVRLSSKDQVCLVPADDDTRGVPANLAAAVFERYGIQQPQPRAWEVDYLISPALGGAEDVRNLWPQAYSQGVWTSRVKDALEDQLRRMVCEGTVDLATAQREISSNWIGAYRKYFRTAEPLAAHAAFVKDRPWE